jgi:uncharacterized membrane protein YqjE
MKMTTKKFVQYLILLLLTAFGIWLQGFWGGFAVGFAAMLILVSIVGEWQLKKALKKVDEQIAKRRSY